MPGVGAQQKSQKLGRSLLQPERARRVALRVENSLFLINAAFEVEHHGAIFAFAAPWIGNVAGVDSLHEFYGSRSLTIRLNDAFFGHHPLPLRTQCTRSTERCQGLAGLYSNSSEGAAAATDFRSSFLHSRTLGMWIAAALSLRLARALGRPARVSVNSSTTASKALRWAIPTDAMEGVSASFPTAITFCSRPER